MTQDGEVGMNLVHDGFEVGINLMEEEAEAGLGVTDDVRGITEGGDGTGKFVTVQINDVVVKLGANGLEQSDEFGGRRVFTQRLNATDARIAVEEWHEVRSGEHVDSGVGEIITQDAQDGRNEQGVADMHHVNDEEFHAQHPFERSKAIVAVRARKSSERIGKEVSKSELDRSVRKV